MSGVDNVNNSYAQQLFQTQNASATQNTANSTEEQEEASKVAAAAAEDTYAGSTATANPGTYNKDGFIVDRQQLEAQKFYRRSNADAFLKMLDGSNKTQNTKSNDVNTDYWSKWVQEQVGRQYTVSEAQELISDDGYWGVEKTSDRIVEMAKTLSGGDISKFDELMGAIQEGFGAAEKEIGSLPDISKKTYDAVMEKMQAWKDEATGTTNTMTEDAVNATGALE